MKSQADRAVSVVTAEGMIDTADKIGIHTVSEEVPHHPNYLSHLDSLSGSCLP